MNKGVDQFQFVTITVYRRYGRHCFFAGAAITLIVCLILGALVP